DLTGAARGDDASGLAAASGGDLTGDGGATGGGDLVGPGRLTWDPASLAYIRVRAGGAVLCLPSVLASDAGEALDHRLPLMRSEDALAAAAARALRVLDDVSDHRVQPTVALTRGFEFTDHGPRSARTKADRASACVIAAERE